MIWSVAKAVIRIWCETWNLNRESYLVITHKAIKFHAWHWEMMKTEKVLLDTLISKQYWVGIKSIRWTKIEGVRIYQYLANLLENDEKHQTKI